MIPLTFQHGSPMCRPPFKHAADDMASAGRCVAKFDHFCTMLNTPIGDANHARFWLFAVMQTYIIAWGICVCWEATVCLLPFSRASQVCSAAS